MTIEGIELNISLRDTSMKEYVEELLEQLQELHDNMNTHAMSDHILSLRGKKEMLGNIIEYINKTR